MPAVKIEPSRTDELQLLKLHGTENQRERWVEGLLPEDELLALARNVLFEPFAEFRRWQKLQLQDVKHERNCTGGTIAFTTRKPDDLTADEWALYKKISGVAIDHVTRMHELRKAAGGLPYQLTGITKVGGSLVEHVGTCSHCKAECFGRAASIRIEWAGRPLSREYSLEVR